MSRSNRALSCRGKGWWRWQWGALEVALVGAHSNRHSCVRGPPEADCQGQNLPDQNLLDFSIFSL